jgi:hypothetical protein
MEPGSMVLLTPDDGNVMAAFVQFQGMPEDRKNVSTAWNVRTPDWWPKSFSVSGTTPQSLPPCWPL